MRELFQPPPAAAVKDFFIGFLVGCNTALREHRQGVRLQDAVAPVLALYYALRFAETNADRFNKAVVVALGMAIGHLIMSAIISFSNPAPEDAKPLLHRFL